MDRAMDFHGNSLRKVAVQKLGDLRWRVKPNPSTHGVIALLPQHGHDTPP